MNRLESSFLGFDGYMFEHEGELYRAVNLSYKPAYDHLMHSVLYQRLVERKLTVHFEEVEQSSLGF